MKQPPDTRERLLQTAADLIWSSSYHSTGVDRICEQSGANKGSFYHHFASKEELAIAALEEQWRARRARMDEVFSPSLAPLERLHQFARECLRIQRERRDQAGFVCGCPLYALGSEIGTQSQKLRAKVEELLEARFAYFEALVRDACAAGDVSAPDPSRTARVLLDVVEGALTRARITNDLQPIAELEQSLLLVLGVTPTPKRKRAKAREPR